MRKMVRPPDCPIEDGDIPDAPRLDHWMFRKCKEQWAIFLLSFPTMLFWSLLWLVLR